MLNQTVLLTAQTSQTTSRTSRHRARPFQLARLALGGILIVAAAFKCYGYLQGVEPSIALLKSPYAQITVIETELIIGFWLLSGLAPRWSYRVALVIFCGFLIVSAYEVVARARTCGCFGPIPVNPKVSLGLDVFALAALVLGRKVLMGGLGISALQRWLSIVAGATCLVVTAALFTHWDLTIEHGGLIVLRPADWIGKRFPLENYLDDDGRLRHGNWIVLLYRHDCPVCETAMPAYLQTGRRLSGEFGKPVRMAFVEVPTGEGTNSASNEHCCHWFKLSENKIWTGATPVVLMLRDGRVDQAMQGEDAINPPRSAEQWLRTSSD